MRFKIQGLKSKVQGLGFKVLLFFSLFTFLLATVSHATDDTGTQGKGKFQLEVISEFSRDKKTEEGVTTKNTSFRQTKTHIGKAYGMYLLNQRWKLSKT